MERIENPDGSVTHRIDVSEATAQRLDRYLALRLSISRSQVASLIESGRIRVNDRLPRKSDTPEPGDRIVVSVPPPPAVEALPEDIPVEILFEDDVLLVVDKPAGMVVHPAPGHPDGTLINALLHRVDRLSPLGGSRRPGIVHRLDKDTSGLMIVAKDERIHRRLAEELVRRRITRRYLAVCWGHLDGDHLVIEADVGRHRGDRKRMAVVPGQRPALTEIDRLESWRAADFLKVRLHTGRTHQIRVHLHHVGHPVVGDRQYGAGWERGLAGSWPRELVARVSRQFLHACELSFRHPVSGEVLELASPLPADLSEVAEWARRTS